MSAPFPTPTYRPVHVGGAVDVHVEPRADGSVLLRSTEALRAYPLRLTDALERWAEQAPDRSLVAQRVRQVDANGQATRGDWRHVGYAQMLQRAQAIGQALVDRGLSAERPVVILSDNDIEHLSLALGALWAGIPHAPISSACSLVSQDFGKLRLILATLTPGLVFASGPAYAKAIAACVGSDVEVVLVEPVGDGTLDGRVVTPFDALLATQPGETGSAAHAAVCPDTIAKFLFTSGSTRNPQAVVNTHRMLCANQQMIRQCMAFLADEPPVLVDWLPWSHTFGGNHNVGIALCNGGTLYIDEGRPTPAGIAETLRNLREVSPTVHFNVPKGLEEIAAAAEHDEALRRSLFARVHAFFFAGAGLSQAVWDRLDRLGQQTVGHRIPMLSGLGMTETAPLAMFAVGADNGADNGADPGAGSIGLPVPGVEVKLVRQGDGPQAKTEVRFRGPNVMPGYWRARQQTADAFDAEGYYRTGDAVQFIDPARPTRGLRFDGRIAEDFKLSTGTFVSVGPLRAHVIAAGDPCVQDVVVTGLDRDEVGALIFPRLASCRRLIDPADRPASLSAPEVLLHPAVRAFFQRLADTLWAAGTGSANRVARLHVLDEPPAIDQGEVTDKGSINQRAVLQHRAARVEALHRAGRGGAAGDPSVILPRRG